LPTKLDRADVTGMLPLGPQLIRSGAPRRIACIDRLAGRQQGEMSLAPGDCVRLHPVASPIRLLPEEVTAPAQSTGTLKGGLLRRFALLWAMIVFCMMTVPLRLVRPPGLPTQAAKTVFCTTLVFMRDRVVSTLTLKLPALQVPLFGVNVL